MDTSKLKPFDLEKAKQGKPFCYWNGYNFGTHKKIVKYLGTKTNGSHVYEVEQPDGSFDVSWAPESSLRMLPEVKTEVFFLYRSMGRICACRKDNWLLDVGDAFFIKEFEVEYEDEE